MKLEKDLGTYSRWIVREYLSFRTNTTSAPDQIRDGKTGLVKSVTRVSAGLFTIALQTQRPMIQRHIVVQPSLGQVNTPPTQGCAVAYVDGSYNEAAGTFQVQVFSLSDTPSAVDPDALCRIGVRLVGSISSVGTDAA